MALFDDGEIIDPDVSEPSVATANPTDAPTPDPELEPPGSASGQYGLVHCPPREVHPEVAFVLLHGVSI